MAADVPGCERSPLAAIRQVMCPRPPAAGQPHAADGPDRESSPGRDPAGAGPWPQAAGEPQRVRTDLEETGMVRSWMLILPEPPAPQLRGVESNLTLSVAAATRVNVVNRFGDTEIILFPRSCTARPFLKTLSLGIPGQASSDRSGNRLRDDGKTAKMR